MDQESRKNDTERDVWFSSQRSAIPFGKFESGTDDTFPCNESMVGREGARAKLIDFLLNSGTRKAILVTGRRGMGKTSFVQYCLREYEDSYVERHWQGDSGRTIRSLIWFFVIGALSASAVVITNRLLQILVSEAAIKQHLLWIPTALLLIFACMPLAYGSRLFSVMWGRFPAPHIFGVFITIATTSVLYITPGTGSPVAVLSCLIVSICAIYYTGELWDLISSIRHVGQCSSNESSSDKTSNEKSAARNYLGGPMLAFIGVIAYILSCNTGYLIRYEEEFSSTFSIVAGTSRFITNIVISLILFLGAITTRSFRLSINKKRIPLKGSTPLQISEVVSTARLWYAMMAFPLVAVLVVFIVFLPNISNREYRLTIESGWTLLLCGILLMPTIYTFCRPRDTSRDKNEGAPNPHDSARQLYPSAILLSKGVLFVLVAMHMAHPAQILLQSDDCTWEDASGQIALFQNHNAKANPLFFLTEARPYCSGDLRKNSPLVADAMQQYYSMFLSSQGELTYILTLNVIFGLLFWIEYEWIIRPQHFYRRDSAMFGNSGQRPDYYEDSQPKLRITQLLSTFQRKCEDAKQVRREIIRYFESIAYARRRNKDYESVTFLRAFYEINSATIINTINLGFEQLDHRSVIHGMLLSLRNEYSEKFLSFKSRRVLVRMVFLLFAAMLLVTAVSEQLFDPVTTDKKGGRKPVASILSSCDLEPLQLPRIPRLLCSLDGNIPKFVLRILYFEVLTVEISSATLPENDILRLFFAINQPYYAPDDSLQRLCLCLYHAVIFLLLFFFFSKLNRHFSFIPYSVILDKIDDLLDALTSTTTTKKSRDIGRIAPWMPSRFSEPQESEKSTTRGNLDPRIVELAFMRVLEEMSLSRSIYFRPLYSSDKVPAVEITFVFDELDKLATDIHSQDATGNPDSNDSELHRLNLMKGLLSNMKRIITASSARYIFLGGRLLHDDWLADGARRQPLLTSIFADEIYLPSLLCDSSVGWFARRGNSVNTKENSEVPGNHSLHARVEELFVLQYFLARTRFKMWASRTWFPLIALRESNLLPRGFVQASYRDLKTLMRTAEQIKRLDDRLNSPLRCIPIRFTDDGDKIDQEDSPGREHARLKALVHFLAYRSAGNPKRLNELLAGFMMSADRAVTNKHARDEGFNCQDVLFLSDRKVIRIQLIARVYQQLRKGFEEKIRGRDDKTVTSLLYLSDFLFKFHGRAFSWENLELIDDLMHMHRGHDLRSLLQNLVDHFADRFLHRISNGMYMYRFRSYFANELEYLSRNSDEEMAAFNFTLDEAQAMRDNLTSILERGDNRDKSDILSMLGELHEFYQEYDVAREYYRQCIRAREPMLKENAGTTFNLDGQSIPVLGAIFTQHQAGIDAIRALLHWGPITLRLQLKIAMTYERAGNFEAALIRYQRCMQFSKSMIQAFSNLEPKQANHTICLQSSDGGSRKSSNPYLFEHLGILFEPLFAYAWLLEKNAFTSKNSYDVLAEGVKWFNDVLMVEKWKASAGLVGAQWERKLGTLCFYRGLTRRGSDESYISIAQDCYRKSAIRLAHYFCANADGNTGHDPGHSEYRSFAQAIYGQRYPAEHNMSVAECIGDLSESLLAEIRPHELFSRHPNQHGRRTYDKEVSALLLELDALFFNNNCWEETTEEIPLNTLRNFFDGDVLHRFESAMNLGMASSFYLLRAGYSDSAAREATHTIEVINQYLNWCLLCVVDNGFENRKPSGSLVGVMLDMTIWYADFYLLWVLRTVRFAANRNSEGVATSNGSSGNGPGVGPYLIGDIIPASALTTVASIGMLCSVFLHAQAGLTEVSKMPIKIRLKKLAEVLTSWTGNRVIDYDIKQFDFFQFFQRTLINSLKRHRYPVLNQLNALKSLADASLFKTMLSGNSDDTFKTKCWVQELYHINEQYNHPLHFTPMQSGLTFYLCWRVANEQSIDSSQLLIHEFDVKAEARKHLARSLDICHMGRGYFSAIKKLYYLYDDFNDNQIHRNHAMQMAGSIVVKDALIRVTSSK